MGTLRRDTEPESIEPVLAWLAASPSADPLADLVALRRSLRSLAASDVPGSHKLRIMKIFDPRIGRAHDEVQSLLLDAAVPLNQALSDISRAMVECHGIAAGILRTADANSNAMVHLDCQLLLSLLAFSRSSHGFWRVVAECLPAISTDPHTRIMIGRMFALAAAQPDSFTPRELMFLHTVLRRTEARIELNHDLPERLPDTLFWLAPEQDSTPWPAARKAPTPGTGCLAADFAPLIETVKGTVELLESGTPAAQLGLPREANLPDYRNVLQRALSLWSAPPMRRLMRRAQRQEVRLCARLGDLWRLLHDETLPDGQISDWLITNKSPNGCAVTHLAGTVSGLVAGAALGIREGPDAPWSICLVRWARSDGPNQVDMGIEFIAPHAQAVRLVPDTPDQEVVPALLLPALPRILRREALLIARGRYRRHNFNLVGGKTDRITLSRCQPGSMIHETSSVEIFEFERLREPG